jgi:hypothetical protein
VAKGIALVLMNQLDTMSRHVFCLFFEYLSTEMREEGTRTKKIDGALKQVVHKENFN